MDGRVVASRRVKDGAPIATERLEFALAAAAAFVANDGAAAAAVEEASGSRVKVQFKNFSIYYTVCKLWVMGDIV